LKEFIFYISALLILSASLLIAFSYSVKNSLKYLAYFAAGFAGLMLILNSHLYSAILILALLFLFSAANLLRTKISGYIDYTEAAQPRVNLISVVTISALAAVMAGIGGSAKWKVFAINYDLNSFSLIFTKYLPIFIVLALLASVIISAAGSIRSGEGVKS
jgi:NADH:ubiquinone oxidoreductase subunit 6 (subunit J)